MSTDERNFRSTYYEKVGFKSVEEKKSLEILLKDKRRDRTKLKQFCLRFTLPGVYRGLVWKIVLTVLPVNVDSYDFCMEQQQEACRDTIETLHVMGLIDSGAPRHHLMYAIWLIQQERWHEIYTIKLTDGFPLLAKALDRFFEDDTELFGVLKKLYAFIQGFKPEVPRLIDTLWCLLEKEDDELQKHLKKFNLLSTMTIESWFDSCLAGLFEDIALVKIIDKVVGGSYKILVYFVITLLKNQRISLLRCKDEEECLQRLNQIPEEVVDMIVNKAIEWWQQHGSPLTMQDKPKI